MFHPFPDEKLATQVIGRFGPVGIGIELLQPAFKLPKFQEGNRYRVLVGGMAHVPPGEGFRLYLHGKQILERKQGVGPRGGGQPQCYYIDQAWWPAFDKKVTGAAMGFLHNYCGKHARGVKRQHFSIWFQEMKNPPLPEEAFSKGRTLQPMRCRAWQETKDNKDLFLFDDIFVKNKDVEGKWSQIGKVASIDGFDPGTPVTADPKGLQEIELRKDGQTDNVDYAWSGDTLMDLTGREALKMTLKKVGGDDVLFIEAGGWQPNHPADWKPELYVMKRK